MTNVLTVNPVKRVRGRLRVPGDKSISHRAVMFGALACGTTVVRGFLDSADCLDTMTAVQSLGAEIERDGQTLRIAGTGGSLRAPTGDLDLGNSGTGMRLLSGILAAQPFTTVLTGDASLCRRPMGRIRDPLERMGARVELTGARGTAPIRIRGGALKGITYEMPVASAQVKSCILLAGLFADGSTCVVEPGPSRDHTERLLQAMGVEVLVEGARISIQGVGYDARPVLDPLDIDIPGDFSSGAFWLAAGAARPGNRVTVDAVGLNPRRTAFLDVLRRMGAQVTVERPAADQGSCRAEPSGSVTVEGADLAATDVGGDEVPNLIDELPLVAALGSLAEGQTTIRDARELRVKESDRIAVVAEGLQALGARVSVHEDGLTVEGKAQLKSGAVIESRGDHRIAMAMAVLALFADRPVRIRDTACIATSYPGFDHDLLTLGGGGGQGS